MKRTFTFLLITLLAISSTTAQVLLNESFEDCKSGFIPTGWTSTTSTWHTTKEETTISATGFYGDPYGSYYAYINDNYSNGSNNNAILVLPALDFSSVANPYVSCVFIFEMITDESFEIVVSTDGGGTWTSVAYPGPNPTHIRKWKYTEANLSAYAGMSSVLVGFKYSDGGGWKRGLAIDNVKVYDKKQADVALQHIEMGKYFGTGSYVNMYCRNYGTDVINSLDAEYAIDGVVQSVQTFTGLNIEPGKGELIWFPVPAKGIVASTTWGKLEVAVTKVNGITDGNDLDNKAVRTFIPASAVTDRNGIIELFGNRGCPSCIEYSRSFDPVSLNKRANKLYSRFNIIRYQLDFPAVDLSFNTHAKQRQYYYDIDGITAHFTNGIHGTTYPSSSDMQLEEEIDNAKREKAVLDIEGSYNVAGNTVSGTVKITPHITYPGSYSVYLAVTEHYYYDSGAYSYQKHFYSVMRKMLPDAQGYKVTEWKDGQAVSYSFNNTFDVGNVTSGDFNFWGDVQKSDLVVFVQDNETKEVLQSLSIAANSTANTGVAKLASVNNVMLYPNPADDRVTIGFKSLITQEAEIAICDMTGKQLYACKKQLTAGQQSIEIPLKNIPAGMYNIRIVAQQEVISKPLVVAR